MITDFFLIHSLSLDLLPYFIKLNIPLGCPEHLVHAAECLLKSCLYATHFEVLIFDQFVDEISLHELRHFRPSMSVKDSKNSIVFTVGSFDIQLSDSSILHALAPALHLTGRVSHTIVCLRFGVFHLNRLA